MDYILNLLKNNLSREKANLEFWQSRIGSADKIESRQAEGNINSNGIRVKELEDAIDLISSYKKSTQKRNWTVTGTLIELTENGQKIVERAEAKKQQFKAV